MVSDPEFLKNKGSDIFAGITVNEPSPELTEKQQARLQELIKDPDIVCAANHFAMKGREFYTGLNRLQKFEINANLVMMNMFGMLKENGTIETGDLVAMVKAGNWRMPSAFHEGLGIMKQEAENLPSEQQEKWNELLPLLHVTAVDLDAAKKEMGKAPDAYKPVIDSVAEGFAGQRKKDCPSR